MQELAKKKARDIAKTRIEAGYKRDNTQAISSNDYETTPAKSLAEIEGESPGSTSRKETGIKKSAFQARLDEQEMKGVAKKAPKKGMQLGKPKGKKN